MGFLGALPKFQVFLVFALDFSLERVPCLKSAILPLAADAVKNGCFAVIFGFDVRRQRFADVREEFVIGELLELRDGGVH
jgi:hypothetical protein